ncbi:hypothetical protein J2797_006668 [Paraburkholderia terricola]|jgi:hypothetical protein|nr:hypothetical protein [Paraburkholderia terricola]
MSVYDQFCLDRAEDAGNPKQIDLYPGQFVFGGNGGLELFAFDLTGNPPWRVLAFDGVDPDGSVRIVAEIVRAVLELADVLRRHGPTYRELHVCSLSHEQRRVMSAIEQYRTAALGGLVEQCDTCGHQRIAYNSCRNRHCPKCQSLARAQWLHDRQADLLPVPYFHVVFTIPEQIASIAFQNKRVVYDILFQATAETLQRGRT